MSPKIFGWIRQLVGFLYRRSEKILVQSQGFTSRILEYGIPKIRVEYLPNWAEDLYQPLVPDVEFAKQEQMMQGFYVLFAGNTGAAQGLETVIDAARLLQLRTDIHFVIIGDGANLEVLRQRAQGLTNVIFKGRKPLETMPAYFALADVLLVHLRRDPLFALTIPSKVQSYLACGRMILAGLEGSGAEVIQESGAGIVVEPENPEALSKAVLHLYQLSATERHAMETRASAYYVKHFSRTRVLDRLLEILKSYQMGEPNE